MRPARPRLAVFSAALAALAAVLAVLLPAGIASAASGPTAETRVWAITSAAHDHVRASDLVSADQHLGGLAECPFCASGACGAACHAVHAWHTVTHYYHAAVHVVVQTADVAGLAAALRDARVALARGVAVAGHLARDVGTGIADAARAGAHVLGSAWHAAVSAGAAVAHGVTRYASQQYHAVVHAVQTAYHAVARAATATVHFVKSHAAVIASVVVSTAVFIGCDAALGVATGGIGAVAGAAACGALAGAAGNAVSYGITAAQTGKFSWSALGKSALSGAEAGAVTGLLGGVGGEVLSVAGGLLSRGAATAAQDATTAAAASGAEATTAAAASDTATSVARDAGSTAPEAAGNQAIAAIGPAGNAGAFPAFRASASSLQKVFSSHGPDFGFTGNWNKAADPLLEKALAEHILDAAGTIRMPGTYRGVMSVIHNIDPVSGLNVMQSPAGDLISGWRLNPQQLWNVLTRGSL